jgi:hypothetical protein
MVLLYPSKQSMVFLQASKQNTVIAVRQQIWNINYSSVRKKKSYRYLCMGIKLLSYANMHSVLLIYDINHNVVIIRYHSGGSMKLNACILILIHMVYL